MMGKVTVTVHAIVKDGKRLETIEDIRNAAVFYGTPGECFSFLSAAHQSFQKAHSVYEITYTMESASIGNILRELKEEQDRPEIEPGG